MAITFPTRVGDGDIVPGFGVPMSDIQTDMRIENGYIYGTLKYCDDVTAISGQPSSLLDHGYNVIIRFEGFNGAIFYGINTAVKVDGQMTPGSPLALIDQDQSASRYDFVFHISPMPDGQSGTLEPEDEAPDMEITWSYRYPGDTENRTATYKINSETLILEPQV